MFECSLRRLEQETGIYIRFAVGEAPEEAREEIAAEQAAHGAFMHIPLRVRPPAQHSTALLTHHYTCTAACMSAPASARRC